MSARVSLMPCFRPEIICDRVAPAGGVFSNASDSWRNSGVNFGLAAMNHSTSCSGVSFMWLNSRSQPDDRRPEQTYVQQQPDGPGKDAPGHHARANQAT